MYRPAAPEPAQTREAHLEAGKHLLIEKPMTIRADEARELMAVADRSGLEVVVSCPWHYTAHGLETRRTAAPPRDEAAERKEDHERRMEIRLERRRQRDRDTESRER